MRKTIESESVGGGDANETGKPLSKFLRRLQNKINFLIATAALERFRLGPQPDAQSVAFEHTPGDWEAGEPKAARPRQEVYNLGTFCTGVNRDELSVRLTYADGKPVVSDDATLADTDNDVKPVPRNYIEEDFKAPYVMEIVEIKNPTSINSYAELGQHVGRRVSVNQITLNPKRHDDVENWYVVCAGTPRIYGQLRLVGNLFFVMPDETSLSQMQHLSEHPYQYFSPKTFSIMDPKLED